MPNTIPRPLRHIDIQIQRVFPAFQGRYSLFVDGVTATGESVILQVKDFAPTVLLQLPAGQDTTDLDIESDVCVPLLEYLDQCADSRRVPTDLIIDFKMVRRTPFIGFTNNRLDSLIKLTIASLGWLKRVTKALETLNYQVYHQDVRPENQFLTRTGVEYQSWVRIQNVSWTSTPTKRTTAKYEGSFKMQSLVKDFDHSHLPQVAKTKRCYIRLGAISAESIRSSEEYQPDFRREHDRVTAIAMAFEVTDGAAGGVSTDVLLTSMPGRAAKDLNVEFCATEQDILRRFQELLQQHDPDDIFVFEDIHDPLEYIFGRAHILNLGKYTFWEKLKKNRIRSIPGACTLSQFDVDDILPIPDARPRIKTRNVFYMVRFLARKVFVSVERYDLFTVSRHKAFRKTPYTGKRSASEYFRRSHHYTNSDELFLRNLAHERTLLMDLVRDTGVRLEIANISRVSNTALNDCITRGEQIRVYNKLAHFCIQNKFYINRADLYKKPLRFNIRERPPTYVDPPPDDITLRLRARCEEELKIKQSYFTAKRVQRSFRSNTFGNSASLSIETESVAEGGNVMKPCPRFWGKTRIGVLDFKSLYPSIMMAYQLSYENLVNDERYLDLPGIKYITVAINSHETVVVAQKPGIIPQLLRLLVDSRDAIKRAMRTETDSFRVSVMDKEQNSMKVLCNATYGFCGAGGSNAILAVREVMYITTSIGRYLQKQSASYLARRYGITTVYGDTDSVFVQAPVSGGNGSIEEFFEFVRTAYSVDPQFASWSDVVRHYAATGVDLLAHTRRIQENAILYLLYEQLCKECTALFPDPVILEFENMADNVWMGWVKKCYMYRFWDPSNPTKHKKIKVTGMPMKKRDFPPWTRKILTDVSKLILNDDLASIRPYLKNAMEDLVTHNIDVTHFQVSRKYLGLQEYKHTRLPHVQVALQTERVRRYPCAPGGRIFFVIVPGEQKVYLRARSPKEITCIDTEYYLKNQFYKPVKKLLAFFPETINFDKMFKAYAARLTCKKKRITTFTSSFDPKRLKR